MNSKLLIHLCVLLVLICVTFISYSSAKSDPSIPVGEEQAYDEDYDEDYDDVAVVEEKDETVDVMMATALPLLITVIYAGFLVVTYVLPAFVDKMSEEMYGSSAEVEDDPLHDARAAVAQGDYPEAIRIYRQVFLQNPADRFPVVEIAKLQRENLHSPAVAVETLREALESNDWRENDAAFFMFRIADIYENDLENHEGAIGILKQVQEVLPETRHAANATHKLRELGAI
ncbi:hypothetical protein N9Z02_02720 [Akkermansiaceae bacterium]|nr:hypothetical protein [Akkermansiaceae bacterium]